MRRSRLLVALTLAAAAACRSAPAPESEVWRHLASRYDADGDRRISPAESGREGADFARLDADGDGALTPADFPEERFARDLGIDRMPPELRARMRAVYDARAVVLAYFPQDPAAGGLSFAALAAAFEELDRNGDAALDATEFARATTQRPWGGPGEAWPLLLAAIDRPGAGQGELALAELETYHAGLAGDDGLLRGPPASVRADSRAMASDGPPVGTLAPDFALAPPDGSGGSGGGAPVRLADSRGRPVALIFGSWT